MQLLRRPALLAAVLTSSVIGTLDAQEPDVAGTFYVVTADPLDPKRAPSQLYIVRRADGSVEHVAMSSAQLRAVGGAVQLDRRRVRLAVTRPRSLPRFGARVGSADAPFVVSAIRDIEPLRAADAVPALRADATRMPYLTLLCKFGEFSEVVPGTVADAERAMSATYPGVAHYFDEVSDGRLDVATGSRVFGWYTMPKPRSAYLSESSFLNTTAAATDCAAQADADVFFPDFVGINFIFNTDIGCCAYASGGGLSLDGGPRGYLMTWLHGSSFQQLGVIEHEMGHTLGLQHSSGPYGLTYDSKWDVMSAGAWYFLPDMPFITGTHFNAYGKRQLGWIPDARHFTVTPGTHTILLESTANPGDNGNYLMARIPAPAFEADEYFTLEARGVSGYDAPLPGAGVVMHRVGGGGATPSNVVDPDGNYDPSDAAAVLEPGEWYLDRANGIHVSVEERVGNAFRVTIRLNEFPRVTLDEPTRADTLVAGSTAILRDSAFVAIRGTGLETSWTAAVVSNGPALLATAGGSGDGWLHWSIDPRGLGSGQYFQTIRVRAGTLAQAELSLRVTVFPATELTAGLSQVVLTDSIITGRVGSGAVSTRISGAGAETAAWTVTTDAPWIAVQTPSGAGRGDIFFLRDASALAPGMHVARLTVSVAGAANSPVTLVDSLRVLEVPTMTVTARGPSRTTVPQGGRTAPDSMYIQLSGAWAQSGGWFGGALAPWLGQGSAPAAPGSGWFRFTRSARDLAPGVYPGIWRIRLTAASEITLEIPDTLVVVAAPAAIKLSRTSRRDSVVSTFIPVRDSIWVQTEGPSSSTSQWRASASSDRIFFLPNSLGGPAGSAMGPGWLHLIRNFTLSSAPGVYVDTVTVGFESGAGASARLVDTLFMFSKPAMSLSTSSRRTQMLTGGTTLKADSTDVAFTGWEAQSIAWTAGAKSSWLTITTPTGSGGGKLRWTRSAASLAPGEYVDTISVTAAAAGTPLRFIDTLRVYPPLVIASPADRPPAVMGASYTDDLQSEGGPEGQRAWTLVAGALPAGLTLDASSGRIAGIAETGGGGVFGFTVRVASGDEAAERDFTMTVTKPTLERTAVLDDLLGGAALATDHRRFLDLLGNRNGRVDVGDVRAWLLDTEGATAAAELPRRLRERAKELKEMRKQ